MRDPMAPASGEGAAPLLRLWGPPVLQLGDRALPFANERRWQLLLLLGLHGGAPVERDHCAAMLWPQRSAADARRNLRKVLHDAQGLLPAGSLHASEQTLAWPVLTDWASFESLWRAGQTGRALDALPPLAPAQPLQGMVDAGSEAWAEWLAAQRQRLLGEWTARLQSLLGPASEPGLRRLAAQRLLHEDPLHETAMGVLIDDELAAGRAAQAERLYREFAQRLHDALGVAPSRQLRDRLATVPAPPPPESDPAAMQAARPPEPAPPPAARPFIGRRTERLEAQALMAEPDLRLLTLLGPGGSGKSRLAQVLLEDASRMRFGPRCHWLDLEDLRDGPAVVGRLAQQLGVSVPTPERAAAQLAVGLGTQPALLVLDNAEHLAAVLPPLLHALLAAAPALVLLATSRVRLGVPGERLVPLAGLPVPDADSRDVDAARQFDAVRLFEHHARSARHDFRLEHHLDAVLSICDLVDGLPLALELAAGWVRLLPPAAIAADLGQSLDILQREPAQSGPAGRAEHASMQRVMQRTWALLAPAERDALEALSVFQGGCTREAAAAVANCPLALASALADKSLLGSDEQGRFVLHPLVAAYAQQCLAADPERAAAARDRHALYMARRMQTWAPLAVGAIGKLLRTIDAELANVLAAWRHALAQRRADRIAAMTRGLWAWYEGRSRQAEGVVEMLPALARLGADPAADAAARLAEVRLCQGLSMLLHRNGRNEEAQAMARRGLQWAERCGDTEAHVGCWLNYGMCRWGDGHAAEAADCHRRGEAIAQAAGHLQCLAWARGNLGVTLLNLGRLDEARHLLEQALAGSREVGDVYNEVVHLVNLGNQAFDSLRLDEARSRFEDAHSRAAEQGLLVLQLFAASNLASVRREQGALDEARQGFAAAIQLARRSGTRAVEWSCRTALARLQIQLGQREPALRELQAVVRDCLAAGSEGDVTLCALAYAEWLEAFGEPLRAAALWRLGLQVELLSARRRATVQARLAALGSAADHEAPLTLHEAAQRLLEQR